ncbi:hypothetical protein BC938DRAFT_475159 [Jimgerdemannia flammicorona]|uniref:Uncharacterized protein n=1 Tax=Jimgerdemannia flammicorona TaxID=994334 RepID=A0A433QS01_9FUNG|nr:hypothetical protein BC938DRAFT_475159 [Jimgerdemannia flammicorona]
MFYSLKKYLANGVVPLRHCITEFIKHVFPKFFSPVVPIDTAPNCENELGDMGSWPAAGLIPTLGSMFDTWFLGGMGGGCGGAGPPRAGGGGTGRLGFGASAGGGGS